MSGSVTASQLLVETAGSVAKNIGRLAVIAIGPFLFSWGFVFMAREMAGDMTLGFDSRLGFDFLHGMAVAVLFVLSVQVAQGRGARFDVQAIVRVAILMALFAAGVAAMFLGVKAAVLTYGEAGWVSLLAVVVGSLIMGRLILALPLAVEGIWCLIGFDRSWVALGWLGGVQTMVAAVMSQVAMGLIVVWPLRLLGDAIADAAPWTGLPLHLLSETIMTVVLATVLTRAMAISQADA